MNIKVKKSKSKKEDIFNLIIGQEIGNQKDEVKGGGDNDLYNYSSSNEDELFKLVKKNIKAKEAIIFFIGIFFHFICILFYFLIFFLLSYYFIIYIIVVV